MSLNICTQRKYDTVRISIFVPQRPQSRVCGCMLDSLWSLVGAPSTVHAPSTAHAPCTLLHRRLDGRSWTTMIEELRRLDRPVVMRNVTGTSGAGFRALTLPSVLASRWGDTEVVLSSANAHSYGRRRIRLADYLHDQRLAPDETAAERQCGDSAWEDGRADEIFYWFGEHGPELEPLLEEYRRAAAFADPPVFSDLRRPALSFGAAPHNSGVPFHTHNDGFAEVMHGAKRWLLYPPDRSPPHFAPNTTSAAWLREVYPTLPAGDAPDECVIYPTDVLYFPNGWHHAVVNIGNTVFMSTFF